MFYLNLLINGSGTSLSLSLPKLIRNPPAEMANVEAIDSVTSPSLSLKLQSPSSSSPQLSQHSILRLWKPAAQRNLRNQWSKLAAYRQEWTSLSSAGRSHATSLVNSYLSQKYMDAMELGVLNDMPNIRKKACCKLFKQQEFQGHQLLSSYKDMVALVVRMINTSESMRCFSKGTRGSLLIQFSSSSDDKSDTGDGGGVPVFTFLPVSTFEELAQELVGMFTLELILKRLLVVELLGINCGELEHVDQLSWSDELYQGEANDLSKCNLYSKETLKPLLPRVKDWSSDTTTAIQSHNQPDREVLQVYLTTWLAEVNVDNHRVDEIFDMAGEEMHTSFS
ncbi:hypothetical protein Ancab_036023 [Ancistrocladus abbreviatus]